MLMNVYFAFVCAVPFRKKERISYKHLISMKKPGETALVKVLRDGKQHEFSISLNPVSNYFCDFFVKSSLS